MLIREARSWGPKSGTGLEDGSDTESCELEYWETELVSDGAYGLVALLEGGWLYWCCWGGARPLPLPRTLPPPILRPDMAYFLGGEEDQCGTEVVEEEVV